MDTSFGRAESGRTMAKIDRRQSPDHSAHGSHTAAASSKHVETCADYLYHVENQFSPIGTPTLMKKDTSIATPTHPAPVGETCSGTMREGAQEEITAQIWRTIPLFLKLRDPKQRKSKIMQFLNQQCPSTTNVTTDTGLLTVLLTYIIHSAERVDAGDAIDVLKALFATCLGSEDLADILSLTMDRAAKATVTGREWHTVLDLLLRVHIVW